MKLFKKKVLAYVIIGILIALQIAQSITNWCLASGSDDPVVAAKGFNGGSLILCLISIALFVLIAVGIHKNNRLLTTITGVSLFSVLLFVLIHEYSGSIVWGLSHDTPATRICCASLSIMAVLCLLVCFILTIVKACGVKKDLKLLNTIFSLCAVGFALISFIIGCATLVPRIDLSLTAKLYAIFRQLILIFFALLIPFATYNIDIIKSKVNANVVSKK